MTDDYDHDACDDQRGSGGTEADASGTPLLRLVGSEDARRQIVLKLKSAENAFDLNRVTLDQPNEREVPANDNDGWPLWEMLNRETFEPDAEKRHRFKDTAIHIRELWDTAHGDPMAQAVHRPGKPPTPDHDQQRDKRGKIIFENGFSYDRRAGVYADGDQRFDGALRKSQKSLPVNAGYEGLFAQARLDAQFELDDLAAVLGPLWLPLLDAICKAASFGEISGRWGGYKQTVVGSAFVKLALEVATKHRDAYTNANSFRDFVETTGLPVAARRYRRALAA